MSRSTTRCSWREAVSIGAGVAEVIPVSGSIAARIVSTFTFGCYVGGDGWLAAVGRIPAGPVHVVVPAPLPAVEGAAVVVFADRLVFHGPAGELTVTLDGAAAWAGRVPAGTDALRAAAVLAAMPSIVQPDLAAVWPAVERSLRTGDLAAAGRALEGRGRGSTPVGDDVLAGMLLAHALVRPDPMSERVRVAVAASARTTDLSRAFLRWAAIGQSIEPVHDLLTAAASGQPHRVDEAARRVRAIGASSGVALLEGLRIACGSIA